MQIGPLWGDRDGAANLLGGFRQLRLCRQSLSAREMRVQVIGRGLRNNRARQVEGAEEDARQKQHVPFPTRLKQAKASKSKPPANFHTSIKMQWHSAASSHDSNVGWSKIRTNDSAHQELLGRHRLPFYDANLHAFLDVAISAKVRRSAAE